MRTSSLFSRPRFKLAGAYAGVMGIFLGMIGFALHEAIASSSDYIIERELVTLSTVLEDSLEPLLDTPGRLTSATLQRFPYLCSISQNCQKSLSQAINRRQSDRHADGTAALLHREGYVLYLLDLQGKKIAALQGESQAISPLSVDTTWGNAKNAEGRRYRVYTIQLDATQASDAQPWGYLQISRSYQTLEEYMHWLHVLLLVGIPLSISGIATAAWWLSGLAMQPIFNSYKQIEQFSADVAHELRTPLAAMRATVEAEFSETQAQQPNPNTDPSTVQVLYRQILRLSQMVQDLLLLSRLEGDQSINMQPVCIREILEDLEEEFTPLIAQSDIDLRLELHPTNLLIRGNPDSLYRLFMNLISNAIRYSPAKGIVLVKSKISEAAISISIQDSGPGIPPEAQPYIFQRFYRADGDRSRSTGGTGLGLAIAKAIVQKHGGDITLASHVDHGTQFKVVFSRLRMNALNRAGDY